jgi:hypothetical protein
MRAIYILNFNFNDDIAVIQITLRNLDKTNVNTY